MPWSATWSRKTGSRPGTWIHESRSTASVSDLTLRHLRQAFYRTYPDLRTAPPHPIAASHDSAVAQFPHHLNSVGFLAGFTCPGATPTCRSCCYTQGGQAGLTPARMARARNTHTLLHLCQRRAVRQLADQLGQLMDRGHAQYLRRLSRVQGPEHRRLIRGSLFRHNWSGDLVDATHAQAVYRATTARPHLQCWLYTRSFHLLPHLDPPPANLTVWLSEDVDNGEEVEWVQRRYPWAKRAVLVEREEVTGEDLICPKLRYRDGTTTPILPTTGACARCRICAKPSERVDRVVFPVKHYAPFHPLEILTATQNRKEAVHAVA